MGKVKVVMCPADRAPYVTNISNTLENFQQIVGGYIEAVPFAAHTVIICNEEGRLQGLPENKSVPRSGIVGDCFLVDTAGEEFADLTDVELMLRNCKAAWRRNK